MTMRAACRSCGTNLRPTAKFCDECGVPTAVSGDPAEYKQVTVLFADVVRSMDIAAAVDMERLREIITGLVERLAAVVRRFGGNVERTGDGVMALFGAPIALEDHAFRACLAALAIQEETRRLASDVHHRDGLTLQVRVGLNSGQVIAGDIGSGSLGYAATGHHVGMAQRLESVAPPGGVMLSESTAQLVEHLTVLANPEWVRIKGANEPVRARQLLATGTRDASAGRAEASLVGRRWEMAALDAIVDRSVSGRGGVVNVVGPPGIGKSRVAREVAAIAASRGIDVYWAFCESHAHDVPFHAVTRLLRAGIGVADLDGEVARARVRELVPDADPQDVLLLDDLLGVADPDVALPQIDPDARRRRLTALVNGASLARSGPALYIVEDVHWIDAASESMLADLLTVVARTSSVVLITARPEYDGPLKWVLGTQAIALAPLADPDSAALLGELVGLDPSVSELSTVIADRAAGNPFFAEEMVRELVQRGVLQGELGAYVSRTDATELNVPATVQATIEARIDRLSALAKRTLNAASVIGVRFGADLLTSLIIDAVVDELLTVELIDQVRLAPNPVYAFRHPLIRAVCYESQLKSDRADWHRRLASAIQEREPGSVEENAALIAEHLESADEMPMAYGWHMRAAAWSANRDLDAARASWQRACRIADELSGPDALPMQIAPRTMLCATDFHARFVQGSQDRFEELRKLCNAAGDKVSLAIAMTGLATEFVYTGRSPEGSQLVSEQMEILQTIGDPTMTMSLAVMGFVNWADAAEMDEMLRWSDVVVDMADGDPAKGAGFGVGSPLAAALAARGVARWWLGREGWRQDLENAVAMARDSDPTTVAFVVAWAIGLEIAYGAARADDSAVRAGEEAVQIAQTASNDHALFLAQFALGAILLQRASAADRQRGLEVIVAVREVLREHGPFLVPVTEVLAARENARQGDRDAAIAEIRNAAEELRREYRPGWDVFVLGILVEVLLERRTADDLAEARETIDRLAGLRADRYWPVRDITVLRLRALLARACGDDGDFRDLAARYHTMAESLGYEGHIDQAEAMIE